jgi:hypothetical protein
MMIKVFEIIVCMYLKTIPPDVLRCGRSLHLYVLLPFPPFLSLIHILPICFDSAQVLYIYFLCVIAYKNHLGQCTCIVFILQF